MSKRKDSSAQLCTSFQAHPLSLGRLSNQIEIQFPQICVSFG